MHTKIISIISLFLGSTLAKDDFFGDVKRAELFEKTDFVVPTLTINANEEDFNNFFLRYQCERDMNIRYLNRNEECYQPQWINLDNTIQKAFNEQIIDKSEIDAKDLEIIEKSNITLPEFERIVTTYTNFTLEKILSLGYGLVSLPDFSIDNAGLTFDIDGEVTEVPKIKFSVGGKYTRNFEKLGYNIKIKKGTLFERKQLRLRSEAVDPSFLREKLAYDICNVVELPSLSSNFANVYFNKKYMGLFALRDSFKAQWIEATFGEKSTTHLYTCDGNYGDNKFFNCINDNDEITDDFDFKKFQDRLERTKTRKELEKFFDVKTFIKWQALKYLFGSWDHVTNAHNSVLYMYHDTTSGNDIWIPLLYDFDSEFGAYKDSNTRRTFTQEIYDGSNPIFKILNLKDENKELIGYMEEIMKKAFNPKKLIPRIDELKEFLAPYIKKDRTPDADGNLPGRVKRVNFKIEDYFTYDDFINNSEFTTIKLRKYTSDTTYNEDYILGLKQWMIERFRFVCERYDVDCSYAKEYLGELDYKIDTITYEEKNGGCHNSGYNCCLFDTTDVITSDPVGQWGIENGEWCLFENMQDDCWSEEYGYDCCKLKSTELIYFSKSADHWYGVENGEWCGIVDLQLCPSGGEYPCCQECNILYTDSEDWGIENGSWCSIPHSCKKEDTSSTLTTTTTTTTITTTVTRAITTSVTEETTIAEDPTINSTTITTIMDNASVNSVETSTILESTIESVEVSTSIEATTKPTETSIIVETISQSKTANENNTDLPTKSTIKAIETSTIDETTMEPTEILNAKPVIIKSSTTVTEITSTPSDESTIIIDTSTKTDETTTISTIETTTTTSKSSVKPNATSTLEPIKTTSSKPIKTTNLINSTVTTVESTQIIESAIPEDSTSTVAETTTREPTETATIFDTTTIIVSTETSVVEEKQEPTNKQCSKMYYPCGGVNFSSVSTCCEKGSTCVKHTAYYHQCVPDFELHNYTGLY